MSSSSTDNVKVRDLIFFSVTKIQVEVFWVVIPCNVMVEYLQLNCMVRKIVFIDLFIVETLYNH